MNAADFAIHPVVFHDLWQIGLADGADRSQVVGSGSPAGFCPRLTPGQANCHDFICQKPTARTAAVRFFPDGVRVHLDKMVARCPDDISWRFEISRSPGYVAGVMVRHPQWIIGRLIDLKSPLGNQSPGQIAYVHRVRDFQKVHRTAQSRGEGQTGPPGMASLPPVDLLHPQLAGSLQNPVVYLLQVGIIQEEPEVSAFIAVRAGRPGYAGSVEHLGIADHGVGVDKVIRGRGNEKDFRPYGVYWKFYIQTLGVLEVLFQEGAIIFPGRRPDSQIIARVVHLGHHFGDILGGDSRSRHDFPRGHSNFCRVNSVGAKD